MTGRLVNTVIGVAQGLANQLEGIAGVIFDGVVSVREQRREQVVLQQQIEGAFALAVEQQLEHLVEQPRRGNVVQQLGQLGDGCGAVWLDLEIQLGGEAHRAQHAHRVFLITLHRIADQAYPGIANVLQPIGVIMDIAGTDIVIQGVDGEITALGILLQGAVDVVPQQPTRLALQRLLASQVAFVVIGMAGAEGCHLDDLATKVDVGELESPADQSAIAEGGTDLLWRGAGGDVVILGVHFQQQIANAAAHRKGLIAGLLEALDHRHRVAADLAALQRVLAGRNNSGRGTPMGGSPEGRGYLFQ